MTIQALLIDSREPLGVQRLAFGGVAKQVVALDAGDLQMLCGPNLVAIERKTPTDLLNTLTQRRLFPQLAKLRKTTPWAYLIITGALYPYDGDLVGVVSEAGDHFRETGWTWSALQGALITVQEIGVHITYAANLLDYEAAVLRLARRTRATLRVPPVRDTTLLSEHEAVLTALPGIGPERVGRILERCGTPAWALVNLTENPDLPRHQRHESLVIPGVGPSTRRAVRDVLGLEAWQELAVVNGAVDPKVPAPEVPAPEGDPVPEEGMP